MLDPMILGIDTATPHLCFALVNLDGEVLATFAERVERDHAKRIIPELEHLLDAAKVTKRDLSGVGVGIGPGSYTGLRVGIAAAKGLAAALGIGLRGESTLAAIASAQITADGQGTAALNARRGNVYAATFERVGESLENLEAAHKIALESLQKAQPNTPLFLDEVPDASFLARAFLTHGPNSINPLYL